MKKGFPHLDQFSPQTVGRYQRHAVRLQETADAALAGSALRERLLDLALQYERMALNVGAGNLLSEERVQL
jgi:hypothetical protein